LFIQFREWLLNFGDEQWFFDAEKSELVSSL